MRLSNFNVFHEVLTGSYPSTDFNTSTPVVYREFATNVAAFGKITLQDSSAANAGFNISLDNHVTSSNPLAFDATISAQPSENTGAALVSELLIISNKNFEG